jgi:hypothetical protein
LLYLFQCGSCIEIHPRVNKTLSCHNVPPGWNKIQGETSIHNTQHTTHTNRHQVSCHPPTPQRLCPPLRTQHPLRPQIIAPQLSMGPYQVFGIGIALTLTCSSVWVQTNKFNALTNRFNNKINPIVGGRCREVLEERRSGGGARGGAQSNHLDH